MSEFEDRTRATLEASVERLDARTRSRLNQARQRALAEAEAAAEAREASPWQRLMRPGGWVPAGVVAAAALIAVTLWVSPGGIDRAPQQARFEATTFDDLDLLADADVVDLEAGITDYEFYEWAAGEDEVLGS